MPMIAWLRKGLEHLKALDPWLRAPAGIATIVGTIIAGIMLMIALEEFSLIRGQSPVTGTGGGEVDAKGTQTPGAKGELNQRPPQTPPDSDEVTTPRPLTPQEIEQMSSEQIRHRIDVVLREERFDAVYPLIDALPTQVERDDQRMRLVNKLLADWRTEDAKGAASRIEDQEKREAATVRITQKILEQN